MRKSLLCSAATLAALTLPAVSQAASFTLDFEGVGNQAAILDFYNGGTDSQGNSGTDYGVSFGSNTLGLIDQDAGGGGNFANEPTPDTVMFFLTGSAILNYAPGFDTGFSFFYTSRFAAAIDVYDGLDATGNLLGSINLGINWTDDNCTGDPSGQFCHWDIGSLAFAGIAKSIDFSGTVNQVGFDNITFGSTDPRVPEVPIPAAAWLMGSALAGLFGATRKKAASKA